MSRAIERRVSAAERHLKPTGFTPLVIIVEGGLHGGDPMHATVGVEYLQRQPTESLRDFEARVTAVATAARESFVVIGGLPPDRSSGAQRPDELQRADLAIERDALSIDSGAWSQVNEELDDMLDEGTSGPSR